MTLTEFLNARLDEDEAAADELAWVDTEGYLPMAAREIENDAQRRKERVLREVEAKRRILAEHEPVPSMFGGTTIPCPTLRYLAGVYAGHPDYDPEWT